MTGACARRTKGPSLSKMFNLVHKFNMDTTLHCPEGFHFPVRHSCSRASSSGSIIPGLLMQPPVRGRFETGRSQSPRGPCGHLQECKMVHDERMRAIGCQPPTIHSVNLLWCEQLTEEGEAPKHKNQPPTTMVQCAAMRACVRPAAPPVSPVPRDGRWVAQVEAPDPEQDRLVARGHEDLSV